MNSNAFLQITSIRGNLAARNSLFTCMSMELIRKYSTSCALTSGEKSFKCNLGEKGFTTSHNLAIHKEIYTCAKPFKCDLCDNGFTQSGCLTIHKQSHTGAKPLKCDLCDKGFTTSSDLTKHKQFHTEAKSFK